MKTLLTVLLWRPSYVFILEQLVRANPNLQLDLVLTNDTGKELEIPESISRRFEHIAIFNHPKDLFLHCPHCSQIEYIHHILRQFKGTCLWENILLIYAISKNYDVILFWEDDQIPIWHGGDDFFSSQLNILQNNKKIHLCVSKRRGYLHNIPPYLQKYLSSNILDILERALCLGNEIVFPGLLTEPEKCFIPSDVCSEYGGIEFFGNRKFIYGGSLAINLRLELPCFFDVPDLAKCGISRGNDVFLSLAYGREANFEEAKNCYFHDPYLFSRYPEKSPLAFQKPIDFLDEKRFFTLIESWLSYAPLLLRLTYPSDWDIRINEVESILRNLPSNYYSTYLLFCSFADNIDRTFEMYNNTQRLWKILCDRLRYIGFGDQTPTI